MRLNLREARLTLSRHERWDTVGGLAIDRAIDAATQIGRVVEVLDADGAVHVICHPRGWRTCGGCAGAGEVGGYQCAACAGTGSTGGMIVEVSC